MSRMSEEEILEGLREIDTPTISNVVATYPKSEACLKLYDAWYGEWYTDTSIKCVYPETKPVVGYVATVVFCEASEKYTGVGRWALPEHIDSTGKPVVLVAEQQFPPELANRVGLFGEMMTTRYKALGVAAVVTDGPMRDIDAIKPPKLDPTSLIPDSSERTSFNFCILSWRVPRKLGMIMSGKSCLKKTDLVP